MDKIMGAFLFLRARLNEPSTHAALTGIFAMAGHQFDPGIIQNFMTLGTMVFGVAGFFVAEAKPLTKV